MIDDLSTDNSCEAFESTKSELSISENIKLIKNVDKKYALKNIFDTLENIQPADEDIIVILDGDDWLAGPDVLKKINQIYNDTGCWMTYGSYMEYPAGTRGKFAKQIPEHIILKNSYRDNKWMSSHLRTFKYKLWKKINKEDFIYSKTGEFFKAASDLAAMFPMLEMSGLKARYVEDVLHIYNRQNPLNEDKVDHSFQLSEELEIRAKNKYNRLEELR